MLIARITDAIDRVVFVAPAVSLRVAEALGKTFRRAGGVSVTVILDPDQEPYRLGYGDPEGLARLQELAIDFQIPIRSQAGVRVGLLLTDDNILIWAPTPRSVESPRSNSQPNGLDLETRPGTNLGEDLRQAVGADDSEVPITQAQIGRQPFTPAQVAETKAALAENPPEPFDLARKTRVFSTRYQFVEVEKRGAAWTEREVKLSSLLLNSDVPPGLRDILETRIKPYSGQAEEAIWVPAVVCGQIAYNRRGEEIGEPKTQADMERDWKEILQRYLRKVGGFGSLIKRSDKEAFQAEIAAYEHVLTTWVRGFRELALAAEEDLVADITELVVERAARSRNAGNAYREEIEADVRRGIQRLQVVEPAVKCVFKDIAWESTRDEEFTEALRRALPEAAKEGWFEIFTAAREKEG